MSRCLSGIVVLWALCVFARPAEAARVLTHYDTGSLCSLAQLVVRVQVGAGKAWHTYSGDCTVHEVKVLDVFKGDIAASAVIRVAGLDEYRRAPGMAGVADSWALVAPGDTVYLFLVHKGVTEGYAMYDETDADWKVIESGVRIATAGRVYDVGQYFPPGPSFGPIPGFVAMTDKTFPGTSVPSARDFEPQLRDDLTRRPGEALDPADQRFLIQMKECEAASPLAWSRFQEMQSKLHVPQVAGTRPATRP